MKSDQPIYIGILFSKTGRTSVTERSMLAATEFAIGEINEAGGINGRELVPLYGDPMGEPASYQKLAANLLTESKVKVILGGYTSSQRKAVLSVLDREPGLLCYPAQYEGFEYSENIIYFGAVPNQNSLFLGSYLLQNYSPRLYVVGSDYVWPRESGRIMGDLIRSGGGEILGQYYIEDGAPAKDFDVMMKHIKKCSPDIIFNNFVGQSNLQFYNAYIENGLDADRMLGHCCRTLTLEDSHRESMRLDGLHEQAITRPLPHHELVQLHCLAPQARVPADLAGQGDDLARAA